MGAMLRRCQLGHPYSGNISKVPLFSGLRRPPLRKFTKYAAIYSVYIRYFLAGKLLKTRSCAVCMYMILAKPKTGA